MARQIASAPGSRVRWPGGPVEYLPRRMLVRHTQESLDTPENRFVLFALTQWRDLAATIGQILASQKDSAPSLRGRREVAEVLERLDTILAAELFHEVGVMDQFPSGSPVLQKREGYREIFQMYIQMEAAVALNWQGGADIFQAGQRNVATLYEYWVFLQLAKAVEALCSEGYSTRSLFAVCPDGLSVMQAWAATPGDGCYLTVWPQDSPGTLVQPELLASERALLDRTHAP